MPLDGRTHPAPTQDGKAMWLESCSSFFFLRQDIWGSDACPSMATSRNGQATGDRHKTTTQLRSAHSRPLMLLVTLSYTHQFPFIPLGTGSHPRCISPCPAALDPSAHSAPFSPPHALSSFNITDFCMVSVYSRFFYQ